MLDASQQQHCAKEASDWQYKGDRGLLFSPPSVPLPKGGVLPSIREKFTANPGTNTASLSVSRCTSGGRSCLDLQLSFSNDSGSSNCPFGFGWSLSFPFVMRTIDKELSKY